MLVNTILSAITKDETILKQQESYFIKLNIDDWKRLLKSFIPHLSVRFIMQNKLFETVTSFLKKNSEDNSFRNIRTLNCQG
jgi:hypothetical protein